MTEEEWKADVLKENLQVRVEKVFEALASIGREESLEFLQFLGRWLDRIEGKLRRD